MRSNRPYVQIDPDVLEQARQIDLLSYLRAYEPSNLVKVKGTTNVYCTAEHDSLKMAGGGGFQSAIVCPVRVSTASTKPYSLTFIR